MKLDSLGRSQSLHGVLGVHINVGLGSKGAVGGVLLRADSLQGVHCARVDDVGFSV